MALPSANTGQFYPHPKTLVKIANNNLCMITLMTPHAK